MITEPAPAKINLALHVRARRSDGYHEIETLFAFCRDGDTVTLAPARTNSLRVEGPFADALTQEGGDLNDNLVLRAAAVFNQAFVIGQPNSIVLDKQLPVASGIGGGSADAAATLRALARRHAVALDDPRLVACAEALGSDVPACLLGRTAMGVGRGERLTPLEGLTGTPVLLVNPGVAVSTARVFAGWDGIDHGPIGDGPLTERIYAGRNDLEAPARALAPEIDTVLTALAVTSGVTLVRMSGSGATCFALYDREEDRSAAAAAIRAAHPNWWCLETTLA